MPEHSPKIRQWTSLYATASTASIHYYMTFNPWSTRPSTIIRDNLPFRFKIGIQRQLFLFTYTDHGTNNLPRLSSTREMVSTSVV
jgi:hypothetical protein